MSNVTDMSGMFHAAMFQFLSKWYGSRMTDLSYMFYKAAVSINLWMHLLGLLQKRVVCCWLVIECSRFRFLVVLVVIPHRTRYSEHNYNAQSWNFSVIFIFIFIFIFILFELKFYILSEWKTWKCFVWYRLYFYHQSFDYKESIYFQNRDDKYRRLSLY
jgi:hypothetical protein